MPWASLRSPWLKPSPTTLKSCPMGEAVNTEIQVMPTGTDTASLPESLQFRHFYYSPESSTQLENNCQGVRYLSPELWCLAAYKLTVTYAPATSSQTLPVRAYTQDTVQAHLVHSHMTSVEYRRTLYLYKPMYTYIDIYRDHLQIIFPADNNACIGETLENNLLIRLSEPGDG